MIVPDSRDDADIRLHHVGRVQSSSESYLDYLEIRFLPAEIHETESGNDFESGEFSIFPFFIDRFHFRF